QPDRVCARYRDSPSRARRGRGSAARQKTSSGIAAVRRTAHRASCAVRERRARSKPSPAAAVHAPDRRESAPEQSPESIVRPDSAGPSAQRSPAIARSSGEWKPPAARVRNVPLRNTLLMHQPEKGRGVQEKIMKAEIGLVEGVAQATAKAEAADFARQTEERFAIFRPLELPDGYAYPLAALRVDHFDVAAQALALEFGRAQHLDRAYVHVGGREQAKSAFHGIEQRQKV